VVKFADLDLSNSQMQPCCTRDPGGRKGGVLAAVQLAGGDAIADQCREQAIARAVADVADMTATMRGAPRQSDRQARTVYSTVLLSAAAQSSVLRMPSPNAAATASVRDRTSACRESKRQIDGLR
jgi:hypothetical protein